jgi:pyruvate dehydrogenase E1 component alpha subunit
MGTAAERASAIYDVAQRACSYDMPAETVDGMDVLGVRDAVARAAQRARDRYTPTLLEVRTYRFMGHSMSDPIHGHYRTKDEVEQMKARDPIESFAARLRADGLLDDERWQTMEAEVADEVADAMRFADESPDPDPETLTTDVTREAAP